MLPMLRRAGLSVGLPLALIAVFVALSVYRLGSPGPYYDEWIFVPVALRTLGMCDLAAAVGHDLGCFPLMQAPPYVGAIKAWLSAPVFALFGVDAASTRVPPILLTAGALFVLFRFCAPRIGTGVALVLLAVLATDPALIAHTRIDWGPFVISNLCKLAGLAALWTWLERGGRGPLAVAMLCCVVGFIDKLNFLWLIVAFGGAVVATQPDRVLARLRAATRAERRVLAVTAGVLALLFVVLAIPAMRMDLPGVADHVPIAQRAVHLWQLYNHTFGGTSVFGWVFADALPVRDWPAPLLVLQLPAAAVLLWLRRRAYRDDTVLRLLAFASATIVLLLALMLATRQVGGSHHLMVLWPLPQLQLALLLVGFAAPRRALAATAAVAGAAAALVFAANNLVLAQAYAAGWRGDVAYRPYFDPALYTLSTELGQRAVDGVVSVDWGTHQALVSLLPPALQPSTHDWWSIFNEAVDADPPRTDWLHAAKLAGRTIAFVGYADATGLHRAPMLDAYLRAWHACAGAQWQVAGSDGKPLFDVREYRFAEACD